MSSSNNNSSSNGGAKGIGFGELLTIAFIVLKLCGIITWSWIWVLCPLWISVAIVLGIIIIFAIIALVINKFM